MARIGVGLGVVVVVLLSVWLLGRGPSAPQATAGEAAEETSTHDEAAHRYRTNQSVHWRHVMVGRR